MTEVRIVEFTCFCKIPHKMAVNTSHIIEWQCPQCAMRLTFCVQPGGTVTQITATEPVSPPRPKNLWERIAGDEDDWPV